MRGEIKKSASENAQLGRVRLPYGATPIGNPWTTPDPKGEGAYYNEALDRIHTHVAAQFRQNFDTQEDILSPDSERERQVTAKMAHFVLNSLLAIHTHRAEYHFTNGIDLKSDDEGLVEAAEAGLASPREMFELLRQNPQLQQNPNPRAGSIELAKLVHVFDRGSEDELAMRASIDDIILSHGDRAELLPENRRLKVKRQDLDLPAFIVSCKTDMADLQQDDGTIRIVERRSLLIRGDEAVREGEVFYIDRRIRSAARSDEKLEELKERIFEELKKSPHEQADWLQPTTTSYYAHYL